MEKKLLLNITVGQLKDLNTQGYLSKKGKELLNYVLNYDANCVEREE